MMSRDEFHKRVKEIAEAADDARKGRGNYGDTRFGDQGHVALNLLAELAQVMAERARDDLPDGK